MTGTDHWFDRLTYGYTRRQALRAAAGIVLAWPLLNVVRATSASADAGSCQKGCVWTARARSVTAQATCAGVAGGVGVPASFLAVWLGGLPLALINSAEERCLDSAVLQQKADYYDCIQPGCNGFDPKQPGGPCDSCSNNCCACSASSNGYICCVFGCDDAQHSCCPGG
jgi:hypothetical protein